MSKKRLADNQAREWLQLTLEASNDAVDAISEALRSHGVSGVAVEPHIEAGADDGYLPVGDTSTISAFIYRDDGFEAKFDRIERALWHLRAFDLAPMTELQVREVREEDWANAWKDHFHPLRIGEHIVIKPSWREIEPEVDDIIIELDPGMAFGTGLHPTTRMVLEALEGLDVSGRSVFDVGTGSGILSVAAAKMGSGAVLAVDTERVASDVATENVMLNGVADVIEVRVGTVADGHSRYGVIMANIIASVIADIAPDLRSLMDHDSILIASGIIDVRASLVEESFALAGLEVVEKRVSGDWLCYVARIAATTNPSDVAAQVDGGGVGASEGTAQVDG